MAIAEDQHQLPHCKESVGRGNATLLLGTGHRKLFLKCVIWGINGRVIAIIRKSFRKLFIFVCSGSYNKNTTVCVTYQQQTFIFNSSGSCKSEIWVPYGHMRALFLVHNQHLPVVPHRVEGARELCGISFIRTKIPVMRAHELMKQ